LPGQFQTEVILRIIKKRFKGFGKGGIRHPGKGVKIHIPEGNGTFHGMSQFVDRDIKSFVIQPAGRNAGS